MELLRLAYAKRSFSTKFCVSPTRNDETPICAPPKWASRLRETRVFIFRFFLILLNLRFAYARRDFADSGFGHHAQQQLQFWASRLRQMAISHFGPSFSFFSKVARIFKILRLAYAKWPLWSRRRLDMANNKNNKSAVSSTRNAHFQCFFAFLFFAWFSRICVSSRRNDHFWLDFFDFWTLFSQGVWNLPKS